MTKREMVRFVVVALVAGTTLAFAPCSRRGGAPSSLLFNTIDDPKEENKEIKEEQWGVSYIGGDPCGSKLNDDPFDAAAKSSKPGMPDDMKARIAALAEQKKQQAEKKVG